MADSKKYNGSTWEHSLRKLGTSTDTITALPADIYADGNNATVGISGSTVQNGTPTPDNPIMPQGCGDLETTGEHTGQYKIPISSASTTTPVYLGEVQTTRKIKKIVFVGSEDENWSAQGAGAGATRFGYTLSNSIQADTAHLTSICTHLPLGVEGGTWNTDNIFTISSNYLWIQLDSSITTVASLKSWLAQQYANGTPFTVYYTLATLETGIVNEPLMKIGNYADTVSGITIPTITGKDTFDVLTTLKPSEVELTYTGWHDASVKEKSENLFDKSSDIVGYYISLVGGVWTQTESTSRSVLIKCEPNTTYTIYVPTNRTLRAVYFYNFPSAGDTGYGYTDNTTGDYVNKTLTITTSSSAHYLAFFCYNSAQEATMYDEAEYFSQIMLNEGSTALPYEPYWK